MNVLFDRSFQKDIEAVRDTTILGKLEIVIVEIKNASRLTDIKNITQMTDNHGYYRVKVGAYRIGLRFTDQKVIFERFLNRKDIYKYFPRP